MAALPAVPSHRVLSDAYPAMPPAKRILVVEDERIVALDLTATLEDLGYVVVGTAATAAEARAEALRTVPDLVLMDVRLAGDVDGIELAGGLRNELDVPIVFLTANADDETLRRALGTTPAGFLTKPFSEPTLRSTIEVALVKHSAESSLRGENVELRRESRVDPLTGLYNRRHLDGVLARELEFAQRESHAVGLILLDLDHFKRINDEFGHPAGDAVLCGVARVLVSRLRAYDVVCRYGGEELVVVLPGADSQTTAKVAESLRQAIGRARFSDADRELPRVSASFGVSSFPEHGRSAEDLLRRADQAVYDAKAGGRDRVVVATS